MTRDEKVAKRQERKTKRVEKRREKRRAQNAQLGEYLNKGLSLREAIHHFKYGYFVRAGEDRQICSWQGICSHPCNGDC